ncbi:thioesterase family protein [Luteipulveratus halotolerans]|uniref:Thioesterase n=1 Tax=Luteipulveratus halotolerans TaxID=1631356 RepID=A0A0L6CLQ7_9MICO|nr:thioesterase family protein [Luteipulveratus halotolerans]KNX38443.1 hypothetical protein VV01_16895 [Luteipulveratus halotolerans]
MTEPTASYEPLGPGRYQPTILVQGAWREDEQHMAVIGGLITHEIEQHEPREGMVLARIAFEILGQIPLQETHIAVETIRPGRTIELIEATATIGDRVIIRARAWRLQTQDTTDVAGVELPSMPAPDDCVETDAAAEWQGRFLTTLDYRAAPGGRDGRRQVWARTDVPLVAGTTVGPVASYVRLVDIANGIATRVRPTEMLYPNVDLTIHLLRTPDPAWVGLDTSVSFGDHGIGLTSTTLNDLRGPIGRAEQCLTVRHFAS